MRAIVICILLLPVCVSCRREPSANHPDEAFLELQAAFASVDHNSKLEISTMRGEKAVVGQAEIQGLADFFKDAQLHEVERPKHKHMEFTGQLIFPEIIGRSGDPMFIRDEVGNVMSSYGYFRLNFRQSQTFKKLLKSIVVDAGL